MTKENFTEAIGLFFGYTIITKERTPDIVAMPHAGEDCRFYANYENSDTKDNRDSPILTGTYGNGKSRDIAVNNYLNEIQGKILVFNAYDDKRRIEINVPKFTIQN